jgi:hypothetical protein
METLEGGREQCAAKADGPSGQEDILGQNWMVTASNVPLLRRSLKMCNLVLTRGIFLIISVRNSRRTLQSYFPDFADTFACNFLTQNSCK